MVKESVLLELSRNKSLRTGFFERDNFDLFGKSEHAKTSSEFQVINNVLEFFTAKNSCILND